MLKEYKLRSISFAILFPVLTGAYYYHRFACATICSLVHCPNVYIYTTGAPTLFPFPSNLIHPSLHRCGSTKRPLLALPSMELRILLKIDLLSRLSNLYKSATASLEERRG